MDHKVVTVCLMTSQRIGEILGELAESRNTGSDCHMAAIETQPRKAITGVNETYYRYARKRRSVEASLDATQ